MLFQFKVISDDTLWIADTQFLTFARVDNPNSKILESGKLVPQGFGVYALEGRTKRSPSGICSFGVNLVGIGQTIKVYIRTNVPVKDFTMPAPIKQIFYEIMPSDPAQIEQSILEITDGGDSNTTSNPSGDSAVGLGPDSAEQTGQGEVGPGTPDGGSLGGEPAGVS